MVKKWLENIKSISNHGNAGKCPFCGSVRTDYKCSVVQWESRNGYMDIWCNDCKKAFHVSRMRISEEMKTEGAIPEGVQY